MNLKIRDIGPAFHISDSYVNSSKFVIWHHTASTASKQAIEDYLCKQNARSVSCHYIIHPDGEIVRLAEHGAVTHHAGYGSWSDEEGEFKNMNFCSIGIEVHSDGKHFTDAQRESAIKLGKFITDLETIPPSRHLRHADVDPNRKTDIGKAFYEPGTWNDFVSKIFQKDESLVDPNDISKESERDSDQHIGRMIQENKVLWQRVCKIRDESEAIMNDLHEHNEFLRSLSSN